MNDFVTSGHTHCSYGIRRESILKENPINRSGMFCLRRASNDDNMSARRDNWLDCHDDDMSARRDNSLARHDDNMSARRDDSLARRSRNRYVPQSQHYIA